MYVCMHVRMVCVFACVNACACACDTMTCVSELRGQRIRTMKRTILDSIAEYRHTNEHLNAFPPHVVVATRFVRERKLFHEQARSSRLPFQSLEGFVDSFSRIT